MPELEKDTFKGSNSAYWGLCLFAGVSALFGGLFDSTFFYTIGGLFLGGSSLGFLLGKYKRIQLLPDTIKIVRGQIGFNKNIPFDQIERISLKKEQEEVTHELISYDLSTVEDWKKIKSLEIQLRKKKVSIPQNEFEEDEFKSLIIQLQQAHLEANGSPLQKVTQMQQTTLRYLREDKRLLAELNQSLLEAYRSVFQAFETLYTKDTVQELAQDSEVLFHTIKQGNVLMYFKEGHYLENIKHASIDSAKALIEAAHTNIDIVTTRLASHQEIKQKLERVRNQYQSRERIQDVASKLDKLQQRNINKSLKQEDHEYDAEVLAQLQLLTENIHNTETLEKSLVLKEHINLFKESLPEEEEVLKELNQKLDK